jgi:hypothetical protein
MSETGPRLNASLVQNPTDSAVIPETAELFVNLMGECGETTQAVSKLLMYGPSSCSPFDPDQEPNIRAIEREVGDILGVVEELIERGVFNRAIIENAAALKRTRLPRWTTGRLAVRDSGVF